MQTRTEKYKYKREQIKKEIEEEFNRLSEELNGLVESLKDDVNLSYVETLNIKNKEIKVFMDDFGQCYILRWIDDDGNIVEESCGTFNHNYEEYARLLFDEEYKINKYRDLGIILATDREFMCRQIAKMLASKSVPSKVFNKYLGNMPFKGRCEDDIFNMIYGNWGGNIGKEN